MKEFMMIWVGEPISSIVSSMTAFVILILLAFALIFGFRKSIREMVRSDLSELVNR